MSELFYGNLLGSSIQNNKFKLNNELIEEYRKKKVPFGFNGLGEIVYLRTYSREKENGENEKWVDTIERVVNGVFEILQHYVVNILKSTWDPCKADMLSKNMFIKMFEMKFLPPGRGLWAMGSPIITKKGFSAALNNCAFVSTIDLKDNKYEPFLFLMDASMLGVGVGFDTLGAGSFIISGFNPNKEKTIHTISDDREGWVYSVELLLKSYFNYTEEIIFNYSNIREAGAKLKIFGGTSSGPDPLIKLHVDVSNLLHGYIDKPISVTCITDIMNMIGVCTVSGNIRRCLPKDSLVHSFNGLIPIQDIKIGDLIQTSTGYEKVIDTMIQGFQNLVSIITQDGIFKCTPNHRMAVMATPTTYKWIAAKDLKPEHILYTTRIPINGTKTQLPEWDYEYPTHSTTCKSITIPELDADIAWLIGIFSGDRYHPFVQASYPNYKLNGFNAHINIVFGIEEYDMALKAKEQLQRFGDTLKITLKKRKNENSYIVLCTSKQLAYYFDKNIKQANNEIIVPEYILTGTLDVRLGYIAGVMDSDGSIKSRPIQIVSTISKVWIMQLQTLCYSCGFETRLKLSTKQTLSRKNWQLIHKLVIITKYSKSIVTNIPQLCKKFTIPDIIARYSNSFPANIVEINDRRYNKNNNILIDLYEQFFDKVNFCPTKVIRLEYNNELVETYDIAVENVHEFYCNGYLTHNSAEIAFGNANCEEFLNLKNYDINPQRMEYGWTSNNSVFADIGMDYSKICESIKNNGEPGIAWLSNMKDYSRLIDFPDHIDYRVSGGNPCLEQSLESMELCCLVETFPTKHENYEDFKDTLYYAFLYAKVVTLLPLHWPKSNDIIMRNRRIGCSVSGIAQFITKHGINELKNWLENGYKVICNYDQTISDWLCIRQSIKKTSVKPSGTISLLTGATPGIHYPESKYYIRRMRISKNSSLLDKIIQAGYNTEPCVLNPTLTTIIEFPIKAGDDIRSIDEVSMWEQLSLAAFMQRYWADNQVSATITFKKEESSQIVHALEYFQYQLKGISFLPKLENDTCYKQMPYESITKEQYDEMYKKINKNISLSSKNMMNEFVLENQLNYCDGDKCIRF